MARAIRARGSSLTLGKEGMLPFSISPAAEAWLARVPTRGGEEPGFMCSPCYGVYRGPTLVEDFRRPHYAFVHTTPMVWQSERSATRVSIAGRSFWLTPDIRESLEGKLLDVVRAEVGKDTFREFLVAECPDAPKA